MSYMAKTTQIIELTPDDVRSAVIMWVATNYNFAPTKVDFCYAEVGGDPLDRYPGRRELVSAKASLEVENARHH